MNHFKLTSAAFLLGMRLSPSAIERLFHQKTIRPSKALEYTNPANLKMAAIQLEPITYESLGAYVDHMESLVRQAADGGAQMVCFPEYTGLLPLLISPALWEYAQDTIQALLSGREEEVKEALDFFGEHLSDALFNCYYNTFALLANRYHLYLHAGSTLLQSRGRLYQRSFLFGPDGEAVGEQDKLLLSPLEQRLGMEPGQDLEILSTSLGKVAILLGRDSDALEPAKLACSLGAQILLCPVAPRTTDSTAPELSGPLMRCQERSVFAVVSCLVGDLGPALFYGQSGLVGPYQASRLPNGICSQADNRVRTAVTVGRFNLERLHQPLNLYTSDSNSAIYAQLESAYRNPPEIPEPASGLPDSDICPVEDQLPAEETMIQ